VKSSVAILQGVPRRAALDALEPILSDLAALHDEVAMLLEKHVNAENLSANESQNDPQQQISESSSKSDLEPGLRNSQGPKSELVKAKAEDATKAYPLGLVMKACPEIADYAVSGISTWRDLMTTAAQVRGYLGISPSAYGEALDVFGQENTTVVIACILQRSQHINSAGGYLRALTGKARAGEFSVGPMLMAALTVDDAEERKKIAQDISRHLLPAPFATATIGQPFLARQALHPKRVLSGMKQIFRHEIYEGLYFGRQVPT
jgi:replication initiation protein RepC